MLFFKKINNDKELKKKKMAIYQNDSKIALSY